MLKATISVMFALLPAITLGQEFLVLDKMGTKKRIEFYPGDPIKFRLKEERIFRTDEIVAITDSVLYMENGIVPFTEIGVVEVTEKWMQATGVTLMVAGVGYIVLDQFNNVIRGDGLRYDDKVVRSGAIIAGAGAALVYFGRRRIKVRNNWRLRLVDMDRP